jgi:WD40 repeat protein
VASYPNDLSPDALQALATRDFDALRTLLRAHPHPLASAIGELVRQHADALGAAPAQLVLQLRARLAPGPVTDEWVADAAPVEESGGLVLRSRSLAGALRPELWTRSVHRNLVHAIAMLPDGDTVLSAGEDGKLLCWFLSEPDQVMELSGHTGPVNHLTISPRGDLVASAGDDHGVIVWRIKPDGTLGVPRHLVGHSHYVRQVAFGTDVLVSVSQDGTARVWSLEQGDLLRTLDHGQDVMSLAISPDGTRLATTTVNSALHLWDLRTGEKVVQLYGNQEKVRNLDSQTYFFSTNYSDIGHKDYPHALGFHQDGSLWSMGTEWIVWDTEKHAERIRQPKQIPHSAHAVVWLDDERVAIGAQGIFIVRVRRDGEWLPSGAEERLGALGVSLKDCSALCLAPDGKTLLSGHRDGAVHAWNLEVDPRTLPVAEHGAPVMDIHASPSGRYLLSSATDGSLCVWDALEGRCVDRLRVSDGFSPKYAFSRDETRLVFGDTKGAIFVRQLPEGGEIARTRIDSKVNYQGTSSVAFGPDPSIIFAGLSLDGLHRVTLGAGDEARSEKFVGHQSDSPSHVWLDADGRTVVVEDRFDPSGERSFQSQRVHLLAWDATTLEARWNLMAAREGSGVLDGGTFGGIVPMGASLLMFDGTPERRMVLRNPTTGSVVRQFSLAPHWFHNVIPLHDGRWFMLLSDGPRSPNRVVVFDPREDRIVHEHHEPSGWLTCTASRDGKVGVRSRAREVEIYGLTTGEVHASFFTDHDVRCARFSPDDARLFVADGGGVMHLLDRVGPV